METKALDLGPVVFLIFAATFVLYTLWFGLIQTLDHFRFVYDINMISRISLLIHHKKEMTPGFDDDCKNYV